MNGHVVKQWQNLSGAAGGPARILPGGYVIAGTGNGLPHQEAPALVQRDWDGKEVWRFDHAEQIPGRDGALVWSARQHHDWQRPGYAAGYYAPGAQPPITNTPTLVLTHSNVVKPQIGDRRLEDDRLIEVSWDGKILWDWRASDHADEFGFSADARSVIRQGLGFNRARDSDDWLHINAAAYVGPNHWFDEGDARFAPDNVIISSREASFIAIVGRSGKIVWRMGPDYRESDALRKLGQIIGQHNPHIIPKGLTGAGNLLVFDNGGTSGYGFANPAAPDGRDSLRRGSSRVVEVNPVTFEKVWEYAVARPGELPVLQPLRERRAATAERQHDDHRGRRRPHLRSDVRRRNRVGVRQPVFHAERRQQPRVSRLPCAVRLDSAAGAPLGARGGAAERQGIPGGPTMSRLLRR